jgi:hypothetical protein
MGAMVYVHAVDVSGIAHKHGRGESDFISGSCEPQDPTRIPFRIHHNELAHFNWPFGRIDTHEPNTVTASIRYSVGERGATHRVKSEVGFPVEE